MEKRKTTQFLMPVEKDGAVVNGYDIYPSLKLGSDVISTDLSVLAEKIKGENTVIIDGYVGVYFENFRSLLDSALTALGKTTNWVNVETALKPENEIDELIFPFLGEEDSIFGTRAAIKLEDYFNLDKLNEITPETNADINLIYGAGASLAGWKGKLLYIDLPKNELQFRARAGSIKNLGASQCFDMKKMYKRYYFVDWVVLNKHKKEILNAIDVIIDGQHEDVFSWMDGENLRTGLKTMGENFFRVRPWFEPGVWGGIWVKDNIEGLNSDVPNYAWSFELITPENGIVFESSRKLLEVSFDLLMFGEGEAVMGAHDHTKYGDEFP